MVAWSVDLKDTWSAAGLAADLVVMLVEYLVASLVGQWVAVRVEMWDA